MQGDKVYPDNCISIMAEDGDAPAPDTFDFAVRERHGYKGAFELAATIDYLFAFDATSELVDDHQYALLTDACACA